MIDRIKAEPVLLGTIAIAVLEVLASEGVTWATPAIAIIGIIVRHFTSPASAVDTAFEDGYFFGKEG